MVTTNRAITRPKIQDRIQNHLLLMTLADDVLMIDNIYCNIYQEYNILYCVKNERMKTISGGVLKKGSTERMKNSRIIVLCY